MTEKIETEIVNEEKEADLDLERDEDEGHGLDQGAGLDQEAETGKRRPAIRSLLCTGINPLLGLNTSPPYSTKQCKVS